MNRPRPKPKRDIALTVALIVGLLAAIALPAWLRVPVEKDPRSRYIAVIYNLRQLSFAADQYYKEHPGVTSVMSADIVGTYPSQYIHTFATVAGETYTARLISGSPITANGVAGARTLTFQ